MEEIFLSLRVLPAFCGANRTRQGIKSALQGNTTDEREVGSMQGKVEISCVNTAKLPLLSSQETETLLRQARDSDHAARERLIHGNLRLVLSVIQRFLGRGENADDLFQVGCIGLMKAIDNFDPAHAVKFSTYGVPMIAGEIRRYLRDNSAMRISRGMRDVAYRALQTREKLTAERGREPDVDEIAAALGVPRSEVVFAMDAICEPVSLYEPVYTESGENVTMMDQVGDTKNTDEHWLIRLALSEALDALSEREKRILSLRFLDGRTQMEVAGEIGISQAQVSRLEKGAVERIKKQITS